MLQDANKSRLLLTEHGINVIMMLPAVPTSCHYG
jgi:hypothetical protein